MKENKKCWACKRTLVGDSKMRLCPGCINKYGSVGAAVAALGLAVGGRQLVKHGGKIIKVSTKIIKH
ncbi:hypothetical protein ACTNBP_09745 [Oliverpabstia intestinalis]|uniref:hypothetical protein n=1 Tax=Oliverpabstia intestinalis TaxID=2606633 RepID=UPI00302897F5|nr:hypothetical protein [Dorea formicigenerans]